MDISKVNPAVQFLLSETDEFASKRKRSRKKEESVIVSKNLKEESISAFLQTHKAPELPDLDALKEKIQNNSYQIDFEKLAESMMQLEKLWM